MSELLDGRTVGGTCRWKEDFVQTLMLFSLFANLVFANGLPSPNKLQPPSGVLREAQGLEKQENRALFLQLLGTQNEALSWPGYPRYWYEDSYTDAIEETARAGVGSGLIPGVSAGVTALEVKFRYNLKTSFVLIATTRQGGQIDPSKLSSVVENTDRKVAKDALGLQDPLGLEIFVQDSNFNYYPNPTPGYPMVGLCYFEVSMIFDRSSSAGVDIFGSGGSHSQIKSRTVSLSLYSNFFQVDGKTSVDQLTQKTCLSVFQEVAKPRVLQLFSPIAIQEKINHSGLSECQRERQYQPRPSESDRGCERAQKWLEVINPYAKEKAVHRCLLWNDGVNRCTARKVEGAECGLFYDAHLKKITASPSKKTRLPTGEVKTTFNQSVTLNLSSGECDFGLQCTLDTQPWIVGGLIIQKAIASCKRR
jgi:hypothetical protein